MVDKEKVKIKFPAWVVMVLLVVVGLGLLSISFLSPEEGWYQIASKAIELIGSALISIGILDFVISLSNENELINRIQAGIDSKTDYSRYKSDELQKIIKNASMAKVNEIYKTDTNKESRCKKLLTRYWECITSPTYLEKYYRDVEVVINDNSMRITTQYDITYVNAHDVELVHYISPLFATEEDAKSFTVFDCKHNGDRISFDKQEKIGKAVVNEVLYQRTPHKQIDVGKEGVHELHYKSRYDTKIGSLFQDQRLRFDCHQYGFHVVLKDLRENKSPKYLLKWDFISWPEISNEISKNKMDMKNDEITIYGNYEWLPKGSGYVLTFNADYSDS